ncbi:DUF3134 domain-containing protein [Nostoc sp. C117]|uniref:DUF3134 domain-containing protein n=1 Tax=Nostoc sp. C117 TaxID=3349875 RepID=UPI00370DE10C
MLNSPLRENPRNQRADVIPLKQESSLIDWLQTNGRLIARNVHEPDFQNDEEEIESLMGVEDGIGYDLDDDDDIEIAED